MNNQSKRIIATVVNSRVLRRVKLVSTGGDVPLVTVSDEDGLVLGTFSFPLGLTSSLAEYVDFFPTACEFSVENGAFLYTGKPIALRTCAHGDTAANPDYEPPRVDPSVLLMQQQLRQLTATVTDLRENPSSASRVKRAVNKKKVNEDESQVEDAAEEQKVGPTVGTEEQETAAQAAE